MSSARKCFKDTKPPREVRESITGGWIWIPRKSEAYYCPCDKCQNLKRDWGLLLETRLAKGGR